MAAKIAAILRLWSDPRFPDADPRCERPRCAGRECYGFTVAV